MLPKVSILIPVYNREQYVAECIESALSQTYGNFEVIIVDNNSTDDTYSICKRYANKSDKVRVFQNKENLGPVRNWLKAAEIADGEYCKILFSDDLMSDDFITKTVQMIIRNDVGFVFTAAIIGERSWAGNPAYLWRKKTGLYDSFSYIESSIYGGSTPVSPSTALFRLDDTRKYLSIDIVSPTIDDFAHHGAGPDILLFLMAAKDYKKVGYIRQKLIFCRKHNESITISSSSRYLGQCYKQAKIWFAYSYLSYGHLNAMLIWEKIRRSILQKRNCSKRSIQKEYISRDLVFHVDDVLASYFHLMRFFRYSVIKKLKK